MYKNQSLRRYIYNRKLLCSLIQEEQLHLTLFFCNVKGLGRIFQVSFSLFTKKPKLLIHLNIWLTLSISEKLNENPLIHSFWVYRVNTDRLWWMCESSLRIDWPITISWSDYWRRQEGGACTTLVYFNNFYQVRWKMNAYFSKTEKD